MYALFVEQSVCDVLEGDVSVGLISRRLDML